jgi:hypothetical protein
MFARITVIHYATVGDHLARTRVVSKDSIEDTVIASRSRLLMIVPEA